ncbi:hypothetical protein D3C86_2013200 [compost metagenome]
MGPLYSNNMFNAGQYSTSFMSLVYTSSLQFKGIHGESFEGVGFSPDTELKIDFNGLAHGKDNQLEAAIRWINSNQ